MDRLDLDAAALRADDADLPALVEALAVRLSAALPRRCAVERRRRRPWSSETRVRRLKVDLGDRRFLLHREHHDVVAEIETAVHDMRRRSEQVALGAWLDALRAELERQATESAEARVALQRLLA